MKRIFYKQDGSVVCVDYPSSMFLGGVYADDKTKPIYEELDDTTQPIYALIEEEVILSDGTKGKVKVNKLTGYKKVTSLKGYEKKELTIDDCKIPDHLKEYSFKIVSDDLPVHEYTEQMIVKDDKIEVDTDKTKTLMPPKFIIAKEVAYQKAILADESKKESPDMNKILLAKVAIDQCGELALEYKQTKDDAKIYELALSNLSRAEIAKPEVEAMLREKVGK